MSAKHKLLYYDVDDAFSTPNSVKPRNFRT
jgi:hypothetical protein